MQKRQNLFDVMAVTAIAFLLFCMFFPLNILNPYNLNWLLVGTDNGENILGSYAWWAEPGHGLRLYNSKLNAPDGVPLLFTDSNPLWTLLMAPIAYIIGPDVQFLGLWMLLCIVLQGIFAWLLLKPYAPSRVALILGTMIMMLLPTLYNRYIHVNLMAHWTILFALWLFISPSRAANVRYWALLLGLTTLIHNYLLLMVAAIWASAVMERFITAPDMKCRAKLVAASCVPAAVVVALILWLDIGGEYPTTNTYGNFMLPLDSLWNPSNQAFSTFLPAFPYRKELEAFQYLGVGILALVVSMPFILWKVPAPKGQDSSVSLKRLLWLIPACAVLLMLAMTHRLNFAGQIIYTIPVTQAVIDVLDPVRASARLFWPIAYILVLLALVSTFRLKRARLFLIFAIMFQLVDMIGMARAIRAELAMDANKTGWQRTSDPRWETAISDAKDIIFVPTDETKDLALFQEVSWRAIGKQIPVRQVYAARMDRRTAERLNSEFALFQSGQLEPSRLYVLLPGARVPESGKERLAVLNGVPVLMPVSTNPKN